HDNRSPLLRPASGCGSGCCVGSNRRKAYGLWHKRPVHARTRGKDPTEYLSTLRAGTWRCARACAARDWQVWRNRTTHIAATGDRGTTPGRTHFDPGARGERHRRHSLVNYPTGLGAEGSDGVLLEDVAPWAVSGKSQINLQPGNKATSLGQFANGSTFN